MYAVRRSRPPKQMFVVSGSPVGDVLEHLAERATSTVMPPFTSVATQTLPSRVDGERVEQLEARQAGEQRAAAGRERHAGGDLARADDVPLPDAPGEGLGDVEPRAVRRQADAVRRVERDTPPRGSSEPSGSRVVEPAAVALALADLAVVGEPEAAVRVEHEVVRPAQRMAVALGVERLDRAASRGRRAGCCRPM